MNALRWDTSPLTGRLLIEASAGTGKTWTIAALYLRLLLDDVDGRGALRPAQVVVATFTDAAAQELGARLRARLEDALAWAMEGAATAACDPVHAWLLERWQANRTTRERDRQRLVAALADADRAPIGTLHALCHRILREYPLDGRLGFAELELVEGRTLREALARDLLRRIAAGDAPPHARALPPGVQSIEALAEHIGLLLQPGATVRPPADPNALRASVDAGLHARIDALATREGFYARADARPLKAARALREWLDDAESPVPDIAALVGGSGITGSVLPPAEAILLDAGFQAAIATLSAALQTLGSPERAFWSWWQPELRRVQVRITSETATLSFDQLIERVREVALRPGSTLPAALAARWPVVLVDEFQDTDAAQYGLLDAWHRAGAAHGLLAMVGDPKQAIYRFRGGDIGVYRRAAAAADAHLTLGENQRSHSRYVAALNHVFGGPRAALSSAVIDPIRVEPVRAAGRADATALAIDGRALERPLIVHAWPESGAVVSDAPSNAKARPLALEACAELVVQLLQPGRVQHGGNALEPGDIAVLLVSNAEVDALRRRLQRRGVPVVGQARRSVFNGEAARDLQLALRAVLHPGDAGALRAALLTPLGGVGVDALADVEANGGLDAFRERCSALRQRWHREGVLAVVHALLREALPRWAGDVDAERRLTDLRHLGELLQDEAAHRHRPEALLDWLREQRDDEDEAGGGERQLRLESDARRVRLMTLHASKGLEFPVVLLPTLWAHEHNPRHAGPMLDGADADGRREVLFEPAALKARRGEQQDERFRLLYVAMTRAKQACHVFTLPPGRPQSASSAKPKGDPERSALDALLSRWPTDERGTAHPAIEWREGWPEPTTLRAPAFNTDESSDDAGPPAAPGPFALPLRYSFSFLAPGKAATALEARAADDEAGMSGGDALDDAEREAERNVDLDAKPRDPLLAALSEAQRTALDAELHALAEVSGAPFGNALHELLEHPPSTGCYADDPARVLDALRAQAVRRADGGDLGALVPRIAAMLDRALSTPLPLPGGPTLGALPRRARRAEMGFHFRLDGVDWSAVRGLAAAHGEPALIPPARDPRLRGSMEGFIDLVFEHAGRAHVLDWKGNTLHRLADATPHGLVAVMDAAHYRFQALLYTVALHRLLRQRKGAGYAIDAHLGAPLYVFLRGFGLAPQLAPALGVWTQPFAPALIESLDALLAGARVDADGRCELETPA